MLSGKNYHIHDDVDIFKLSIEYNGWNVEQFARTKIWIDSQVNSNNNNGDTIVMQFKSDAENDSKQESINCFSNPKYKNQIMEKYLRGLDGNSTLDSKGGCGLELSKWIESAAKFTPDKNNYIEWVDSRKYVPFEHFPSDFNSPIRSNFTMFKQNMFQTRSRLSG